MESNQEKTHFIQSKLPNMGILEFMQWYESQLKHGRVQIQVKESLPSFGRFRLFLELPHTQQILALDTQIKSRKGDVFELTFSVEESTSFVLIHHFVELCLAAQTEFSEQIVPSKESFQLKKLPGKLFLKTQPSFSLSFPSISDFFLFARLQKEGQPLVLSDPLLETQEDPFLLLFHFPFFWVQATFSCQKQSSSQQTFELFPRTPRGQEILDEYLSLVENIFEALESKKKSSLVLPLQIEKVWIQDKTQFKNALPANRVFQDPIALSAKQPTQEISEQEVRSTQKTSHLGLENTSIESTKTQQMEQVSSLEADNEPSTAEASPNQQKTTNPYLKPFKEESTEESHPTTEEAIVSSFEMSGNKVHRIQFASWRNFKDFWKEELSHGLFSFSSKLLPIFEKVFYLSIFPPGIYQDIFIKCEVLEEQKDYTTFRILSDASNEWLKLQRIYHLIELLESPPTTSFVKTTLPETETLLLIDPSELRADEDLALSQEIVFSDPLHFLQCWEKEILQGQLLFECEEELEVGSDALLILSPPGLWHAVILRAKILSSTESFCGITFSIDDFQKTTIEEYSQICHAFLREIEREETSTKSNSSIHCLENIFATESSLAQKELQDVLISISGKKQSGRLEISANDEIIRCYFHFGRLFHVVSSQAETLLKSVLNEEIEPHSLVFERFKELQKQEGLPFEQALFLNEILPKRELGGLYQNYLDVHLNWLWSQTLVSWVFHSGMLGLEERDFFPSIHPLNFLFQKEKKQWANTKLPPDFLSNYVLVSKTPPEQIFVLHLSEQEHAWWKKAQKHPIRAEEIVSGESFPHECFCFLQSLSSMGYLSFSEKINEKDLLQEIFARLKKKIQSFSGSYFSILELPWTSNQEEIQQAFHHLKGHYTAILQNHPKAPDSLWTMQNEVLEMLVICYRTLSNPQKRQEYRQKNIQKDQILFTSHLLMEQGREAMLEKDWQVAKERFLRVLEINPSAKEVLHFLQVVQENL